VSKSTNGSPATVSRLTARVGCRPPRSGGGKD
jgi:hypothetical protein